jgi:RNA polymerase sigma-70 factor (ECF subfamily)
MTTPGQFIKGCRNGDRKAQEAIYRHLFPEAIKIAMRYARDEMEARDILNKAFFKALTKIDSFKGDGSNFFGWLKRIIINEALDLKRAATFRQSFEPIEHETTDYSTDPFKDKEGYDDIIALIQKLPASSSCVFNLFAIDGYSHKEIAQSLGISEDNSRYHLHMARKQLKAWIFKTEKL